MTRLKNLFPFCLLILIAMNFTSCDKKEIIIDALTESEVVEIIESTLQSNVGGLTSNLEDIAMELVTAVSSGELCDTMYSNTLEKSYEGASINSTYTSDLSYEMTCNSLDIPQTASFSISTIDSYSSPRINSEDQSDFVGSAVEIQPSSPTLFIAGNYTRVGTQDLNFREQKSVESTLEVSLTDLGINQKNYAIESGSGAFSFAGSTSDSNFSYSGSIIFNGNQTATISINGTSYDVDWN